MKLICISDVHGHIDNYVNITKHYDKLYDQDIITVALGDMGIGFVTWSQNDQPRGRLQIPILSSRHKFLTGNHDSRSKALEHPNFLGNYSFFIVDNSKIFTISGANTPLFDRNHRTIGIDYFDDEELNATEMKDCIERYKEEKPDIVLSHDAPHSIRNIIYNIDNRTRTSEALEEMFSYHQPKIWVYGHWHKNSDRNIDKTRFICKPELETTIIDLSSLKIL